MSPEQGGGSQVAGRLAQLHEVLVPPDDGHSGFALFGPPISHRGRSFGEPACTHFRLVNLRGFTARK